ncbi:MAG TPA: hypothetical protein VJP80_05615 [Candidatus Saccharimonadales bacterium]|nr:hypothetical protein [Candidatus Saccharimonadales bacterium]
MNRLFGGFLAQNRADRRAQQYRNLIRREAEIGGKLFGPIAKGGRREFFCLDQHTWVWHEEWIDEQGKHHAVTTRYDVRPQGVFKAQDGQPYQKLMRQEALHFRKAVMLYCERVKTELYGVTA